MKYSGLYGAWIFGNVVICSGEMSCEYQVEEYSKNNVLDIEHSSFCRSVLAEAGYVAHEHEVYSA